MPAEVQGAVLVISPDFRRPVAWLEPVPLKMALSTAAAILLARRFTSQLSKAGMAMACTSAVISTVLMSL